MILNKLSITLLLLFLALYACTSEVDSNNRANNSEMNVSLPETEALLNLITEKDSLLFQIGFNQIDTAQVASLLSQDFEFYHDEHGLTDSKNEFLNSINGMHDLPFKTWRVLQEESMEIFPLYNDNNQVPYGAIQNGIHDFYQQYKGEDAHKSNTARFTHLWIFEDGDWKLKRVLSYDHQIPE